jgi:hypothetical protein
MVNQLDLLFRYEKYFLDISAGKVHGSLEAPLSFWSTMGPDSGGGSSSTRCEKFSLDPATDPDDLEEQEVGQLSTYGDFHDCRQYSVVTTQWPSRRTYES